MTNTHPHEGKALSSFIQHNGYSITKLASTLHISRPTLYRRIQSPLLPEEFKKSMTYLIKHHQRTHYFVTDILNIPHTPL